MVSERCEKCRGREGYRNVAMSSSSLFSLSLRCVVRCLLSRLREVRVHTCVHQYINAEKSNTRVLVQHEIEEVVLGSMNQHLHKQTRRRNDNATPLRIAGATRLCVECLHDNSHLSGHVFKDFLALTREERHRWLFAQLADHARRFY